MIKYKGRKPKDEEQDMEGADAKPSLATAMAAKRNVKKMAYGGAAQRETNAVSPQPRKPDNMHPPMSEYMADHFAEGGMAGEDCSNCGHPFNQNPGTPAAKPDDMRPPKDEYMADHFSDGGIAESIMNKKRMASGGMVDINENAEESGQSPYDNDNSEAYKKELYSDDQLSDQPMDSNEHGDSDDDYSISSQVRKRMKMRG